MMRYLTALLLLSAAPTAWAQLTIEGRVVSALDVSADGDVPVEGATVYLYDDDGQLSALDLTGRDGTFRLGPVEAGVYRFLAERPGYESIASDRFRLTESGTDVRLPMERNAVIIDGVVVEAQQHPTALAGFLKRSKERPGRFFGPEELERRDPDLADLAVLVPRLSVRYGSDGARMTARTRRGDPCAPTLFVDDMQIPTTGEFDISNIDRLRAVEVYNTPAEAPVYYRMRAASFTPTSCPLLIVWTEYSLRLRQIAP